MAHMSLRALRGGGTIFGSMAAFLVVETRDHALSRGVIPWCRVAGLAQRHSRRQPNDVANALDEMWGELGLRQTPPAAIISGASGVVPWTEEEASTLASLSASGRGARLRYSGSLFGHGMEASCPFNIGLGALALRHGRIYPPQAGDPADECEIDSFDRVLVTSIGHFRGRGSCCACPCVAANPFASPGWALPHRSAGASAAIGKCSWRVEAVFSLLSMQTGVLPPTINYRVPDPQLPLDVVPNRARKADVRHALSNSFGFGGQNVAILLSREPTG
jgi:3-oxoacyl-(acyl-carrier-protein) synthase